MPENDDAETGNHGSLEGGGSGGGSERVEEHRPREERGGSRISLYVAIVLTVLFLLFPLLRLAGVIAQVRVLDWVYGIVFILAILIALPLMFKLIKSSWFR